MSDWHLIRGDLLPGLLDDWTGPIEWSGDGRQTWRVGGWGPIGPSSEPARCGVIGAYDAQPPPVRLDTRRPEVRDHVLRYLDTAGHDVAWMRDARGGLDAQRSAALIACSCHRVAAGLPVVVNLLGDWRDDANPHSTVASWGWLRRERLGVSRAWAWAHVSTRASPDRWNGSGWGYSPGGPWTETPCGGRETGTAGGAAADVAALAHGCALDDGGLLRLPMPGGEVWEVAP